MRDLRAVIVRVAPLLVLSVLATAQAEARTQLLAQGTDGAVEVTVSGNRVSKRIIRDSGTASYLRDRAEAKGQPWVKLSEPVTVISRRLDGVRHLNDAAWSALVHLSSSGLDRPLSAGSYRFVLLSGPKSYALFENHRGGVRISTFRRKAGEGIATILRKRGFKQNEGYSMNVDELPMPSRRSVTIANLLKRVQNDTIADGPVLARLTSIQSGS